MALPRTPLAQSAEEQLEAKDASDIVDASALPPG